MDSSNSFKSLQPVYKEKYGRLKKLMKARAEKQASEHPKEFMDKMKNPSIKKLKGVAL